MRIGNENPCPICVLITCANFGVDRLKGLGWRDQILPFPIDFLRHPDNIAMKKSDSDTGAYALMATISTTSNFQMLSRHTPNGLR